MGLREKARKVEQEIKHHTYTAVASAFAFVIALVWRDAIRSIIDSIVLTLGLTKTTYYHEIFIALFITILCVIGITLLSHAAHEQ